MPQPPTPGVRAAQQGSLLPIPAGGERKARQATPLTRRYEIVALTAAGRPREFTAVAPASPAFEAAFGAYARGTLIATPEGPVAVEDIAPGDMVETADEGAKPLLWKGAMTIFPDMPDVARRPVALTRITAEAFGIGRPTPDLVLGPWARLALRQAAFRTEVGSEQAMVPASALADDSGVLALRPVTPLRLYHLCLHGQQTIRANGLEAESFHPGDGAEMVMDRTGLGLFLELFPHADRLADFGPMRRPRLSAFEYERTNAA